MVIESEVVEGLWNLQEFTWLSFYVQLHLFFYSWYHHWIIAIFLLVDENVTCIGEIQCRHGSLLLQWNAVWLLESWFCHVRSFYRRKKKEVEDCEPATERNIAGWCAAPCRRVCSACNGTFQHSNNNDCNLVGGQIRTEISELWFFSTQNRYETGTIFLDLFCSVPYEKSHMWHREIVLKKRARKLRKVRYIPRSKTTDFNKFTYCTSSLAILPS